MHAALSIFVVLLFVVLTPGVLLRLTPNGSKYVVAIVHGLVFAFVLHFVYMHYFKMTEGMTKQMKEMKRK
jgi:hypothetical protein